MSIQPTSHARSEMSRWIFGGKRRAATHHECKTNPDARLYKKAEGQLFHLCCIGHVLSDNRYALIATTSRLSRSCGIRVASIDCGVVSTNAHDIRQSATFSFAHTHDAYKITKQPHTVGARRPGNALPLRQPTTAGGGVIVQNRKPRAA